MCSQITSMNKEGKIRQEDDQHASSWASGMGADRHGFPILVSPVTHEHSVPYGRGPLWRHGAKPGHCARCGGS